MLRLALFFVLLLAWACLVAGETAAAGPAAAATPSGALAASIVQDIMGNRDRMIQVALVVVALGIVLLMWRR